MWSFLTRNKSVWHDRARTLGRAASRPRSAPLSLEQLETRYCPSGFLLDCFTYQMTNIGRQVELVGSVSGVDGPASDDSFLEFHTESIKFGRLLQDFRRFSHHLMSNSIARQNGNFVPHGPSLSTNCR